MARGSLLQRMRQSPSGWRQRDVHSVLRRAGFEVAPQVGGHDIFRHRTFTHVKVTVARHREVKAYLVRQVVEAIDLVARLENRDDPANPG